MSDDANSLIQDYQYLFQGQANFRTLWNTVAQFVMPAWDNFIGEFAEGVNRNTRIFDSTGIIANERFGAAMEAILTPRSQIWHKLAAGDEELEDVPAVAQYLDTVNKILFARRYRPEANFASQTDECYLSLGAYGNNCLFVDEELGRGTRYRSIPLSELVWSLNHQGMVDTLYRKFKYTHRQAMQHFKDRTPATVVRQATNNPFAEAEYLHCVRPNGDHVPYAYGDKGKKFESWYVFLGDKSVIQRGGYREFPAAIGRYRVAPREHYGRGPAVTCLPDVRTANEMVKTGLRAGQKAVDPPTLLNEESVLTNFNMRPGANNYGMVTDDGKPLAIPFETKGNWEIGKDMMEGTRAVIKDTFLNTLFQILVQNPNMTATEALLRAQEKGELIAPAMGRQQSEFLGPLIHREIDILTEMKLLPPPPSELLRAKQPMRIEYTSPMARALRAEEGSAIMNTFQDMATMAQIDPTVKTVMDTHDALRTMAQIRGCPAKLIRSEEQVDEILQQQQQAQEQQQQAAAIPGASQAALNLAKANQALGGGAGAPGAVGAGAPAAAAA